MSEDLNSVLKKLIALSERDSKIAGIKAEKKKLEDELNEKQSVMAAAKRDSEDKLIRFHDRKSVADREEKYIRDEQQKLVDRRKSLTGLGSDYKLQMAAEREIEHASKQLGSQEEQLLEILTQVEALEEESDAAKAVFEEKNSEFESFKEEFDGTVVNLDERQKESEQEREGLVKEIDRRSMQLYNRVHSKFPMDSVVAVKNNTCCGCYMDLGPQTAVDISRGNELVRCRGCHRILYNEECGEE